MESIKCPQCGWDVQNFPVQPIFDLEYAAKLLSFPTKEALRAYIERRSHLFPRRYRMATGRVNGVRHRVRVLTASEIQKIQKLYLRGTV